MLLTYCRLLIDFNSLPLYNTLFAPLLPEKIKALKTLVWHLSREQMKELSSLKKLTNSNVWQTSLDEHGEGLTISGKNWFGDELRQVTKGWCIAPLEWCSAYWYFQWKKYCCNHRCHDSVYFHSLFLIIYLSAIETLIWYMRNEFNRVYIVRFCTKYDTRFSKYGIELIVALSSTNATKMHEKQLRNAGYLLFSFLSFLTQYMIWHLQIIWICTSLEFFLIVRSLSVNPFPNSPWFSYPGRLILLKTLWETLLVTSIFSFSHDVFYPIQHKSQIFNYVCLVSTANSFNLD